jgi:hypothetical protein
LGIYLLWTFYRVSCISTDPGSFYRLALTAMGELCQPQPEPQEEINSTELDPLGLAGAIVASEPPIPDENQLKDLCGALFDDFSDYVDYVYAADSSEKVESSYELFRKDIFRRGDHDSEQDLLEDIKQFYVTGAAGSDTVDHNTLSEFYKVCSIEPGLDSTSDSLPSLKTGATVANWNAFIVKLLQSNSWFALHRKQRELISSKCLHTTEVFLKNLSRKYFKEVYANALAEKTTKEFQEIFCNAVSVLPLSKFFSLPQVPRLERVFLKFISREIEYALTTLPKNASKFGLSQICPKAFCSLGSIANYGSDDICSMFPLEPKVDSFERGSNKNGDEKAAVDEISRLLELLAVAVRKQLAVMPFDFALEFDDQGKATRTAQMTFSQFCCAAAKDWDEMDSAEKPGTTNGQLLRDAGIAVEEAAKGHDFLKVMTEDEVLAFIELNPYIPPDAP